jgi:hypothetical protein
MNKTLSQALSAAKPGEGVFQESTTEIVAAIALPCGHLFCTVEHKLTGTCLGDEFYDAADIIEALDDIDIDGEGTTWENEDTFLPRHPEIAAAKAVVTSRRGVQPVWLN